MNIAIIISRLNAPGGTQRQAVELAKQWSKEHKVTIYTNRFDRGNLRYDLGDVGVFVPEELYPASGVPIFGRRIDQIRRAKDLANYISLDTEILNPHGDWAHMVAYYFKQQKNVPSIWMMNTIKKYWFDRKYVYAQDRIVCLDNRNQKEFTKTYGIEPYVVRSGIDISKFQYLERESVKNPRVLMVGSWLPHRRFEDALWACKELGLEVTIAGEKTDGEYFKKCKDINPRTNFIEKLTDQELLLQYYQHNIFIFPNNPQTWGLAVFEAMATGVPVIVSRGAGASEVLKDSENSLLIDNKEQILMSIEYLMMPELYKKISVNGRKFAEENLSWEKYAQDMLRHLIHATC